MLGAVIPHHAVENANTITSSSVLGSRRQESASDIGANPWIVTFRQFRMEVFGVPAPVNRFDGVRSDARVRVRKTCENRLARRIRWHDAQRDHRRRDNAIALAGRRREELQLAFVSDAQSTGPQDRRDARVSVTRLNRGSK